MGKSETPTGKGQPLFISTYDDIGGIATAAPTANRFTAKWIGRLAKPLRVTMFHIYVATAVGDGDIAIGTRLGTTFTRLGSTGAFTLVGAGASQDVAPSATLWLPAGVDLDLGASFSSASSAVARAAPSAALIIVYSRVFYAATQHPVGTGFTVTVGTAFCPWVGMTLSET